MIPLDASAPRSQSMYSLYLGSNVSSRFQIETGDFSDETVVFSLIIVAVH
jgi:hypothetical protein